MKGSLGAGKAIELGKVSSKNKTKTKKPTILQDPSISLYRNFLIQEFQVDLTLALLSIYNWALSREGKKVIFPFLLPYPPASY